MRISACFTTSPDLARREPAAVPEQADAPSGTFLPAVVPAPERRGDTGASGRPVTALLAQLVAGAEDLPAARARRRADPGLGAGLYREVAGLGPAVALHTVKTI